MKSDHISTHMSYANAYATVGTHEELMDAVKKRHGELVWASSMWITDTGKSER